MTTKDRLLIVEDDEPLAETLALELSERGFEVRIADGPNQMQKLTENWAPTHAVVDLRLLGHSGLHILEQLKDRYRRCRVVMLTGYGSVPTAVEAMKLGAVDYLTKPVAIERLYATLIDGETIEETLEELPHEEEQHPSLARHEHEYIEYVLTCCDGNISKAARWLGIHRQSLQRKLRKYPPLR